MFKVDSLSRHDEELVVNITSLIDVIFILLIFFMVSTQFKRSSLPLDLPQSEDTTQEQNTTKVLAVTADAIELDGNAITLEALQAELTVLYQENSELALSLECERTVDFERIVQILTKIQAVGISRIGIVHDPLD
ncbi:MULTISPECIES: biopolymer transporter ExbD [unclassified Treponema]|uniref:ExbD/TolR family protein n=1 Tax=unclassified Treponema TaxID=2638727 RepID=UPI0020A5BBDD|nr:MULTISPECIES: biopolymer transporter ExbD [unclassified Treponema]UTC66177.1 biopolymer transporter ExbD [Treponema sp. OMZ 789]UTC68906.1 biopolymer transporter ExbD [Treponema sp. OMZ 790]UTC71634.1 biopolymer transporter ExbD [Treponema sp. OMZ 791]